ncbi:MAG: type II secretion system protein, partial [Candidatus Omnitrophica bacterium]|nr:type II secretion system protein [Candidatus Omnitrophota bacterium]
MLKNNPLENSCRNAFTLIEVLITVIIVGIIASVALTNLGTTIERSRAHEGEMLAREVFASHIRYAIEHAGIFAASQSSLDFTPRESQYFDSPRSVSFTDSSGSCVFVLVPRKGGGGIHGGMDILTGC